MQNAMRNRRKKRPVLPRIRTDFPYHHSPIGEERRRLERIRDRPVSTDSLLDEVSRRLSSVAPRVVTPDPGYQRSSPAWASVTSSHGATAAPYSTAGPIDHAGSFYPARAEGSMGWAAVYQAQPEPFSYHGDHYSYPRPYAQFQRPSIRRRVPMSPRFTNEAARIAHANKVMNQEKLLMEEYRYPGVQRTYQSPYCAVDPVVRGYKTPTLPHRAVVPHNTPVKGKSVPFSFNPEAPEFRPGTKTQAEKPKKELRYPLIVG